MIGLALALAVAPAITTTAPTLTPPQMSVLAPGAQSLAAADLGDPILADLLVRAALGSLDIRMALARLEKARADVDLARAGRRPQLTVGAEAAVGGADFSSGASGAGAPVFGSYEVDLFHRLKHGQEAAKADEDAAQQDVASARQLVAAEVTRTYLALRAAQVHRAVTEAKATLAGRTEQLVQERHVEGSATEEDLTTSRTTLAQTQAEAQIAAHVVEAQRIRLGVLLGLDVPIDEPAFVDGEIASTPMVAVISSEAVLARPDIQAALARLRAADARRAEAVAASRPRFVLTAGLGSGDTDLLYLLDVRALAWAVTGGLTHQLLDGGAAKARKHGAQAEAEVAELAYRKTVGEAWGQTRLYLAALQDATTTEVLARAARQRALAAVGKGRARHGEGDIDGLALAVLEGQAADADAALTDAQAARARAYVDLSLALGGAA